MHNKDLFEDTLILVQISDMNFSDYSSDGYDNTKLSLLLIHRNENVVIMTKFLSLVALGANILTTSTTASAANFTQMAPFSCPCMTVYVIQYMSWFTGQPGQSAATMVAKIVRLLSVTI